MTSATIGIGLATQQMRELFERFDPQIGCVRKCLFAVRVAQRDPSSSARAKGN